MKGAAVLFRQCAEPCGQSTDECGTAFVCAYAARAGRHHAGHFGVGKKRVPKFCVSCQHYSFAVNAFDEVVKEYDADQYGFTLRETQTGSASRSMN
ncbi:hypothetical protein [Butyricicoccus sp.]